MEIWRAVPLRKLTVYLGHFSETFEADGMREDDDGLHLFLDGDKVAFFVKSQFRGWRLGAPGGAK